MSQNQLCEVYRRDVLSFLSRSFIDEQWRLLSRRFYSTANNYGATLPRIRFEYLRLTFAEERKHKHHKFSQIAPFASLCWPDCEELKELIESHEGLDSYLRSENGCYLRIDGQCKSNGDIWTMAVYNCIDGEDAFELFHLLHHLNGAAFGYIFIIRDGCYRDEGMDVMPRLNSLIFDIIERFSGVPLKLHSKEFFSEMLPQPPSKIFDVFRFPKLHLTGLEGGDLDRLFNLLTKMPNNHLCRVVSVGRADNFAVKHIEQIAEFLDSTCRTARTQLPDVRLYLYTIVKSRPSALPESLSDFADHVKENTKRRSSGAEPDFYIFHRVIDDNEAPADDGGRFAFTIGYELHPSTTKNNLLVDEYEVRIYGLELLCGSYVEGEPSKMWTVEE